MQWTMDQKLRDILLFQGILHASYLKIYEVYHCIPHAQQILHYPYTSPPLFPIPQPLHTHSTPLPISPCHLPLTSLKNYIIIIIIMVQHLHHVQQTLLRVHQAAKSHFAIVVDSPAQTASFLCKEVRLIHYWQLVSSQGLPSLLSLKVTKRLSIEQD